MTDALFLALSVEDVSILKGLLLNAIQDIMETSQMTVLQRLTELEPYRRIYTNLLQAMKEQTATDHG